jgi:hypothetical protein
MGSGTLIKTIIGAKGSGKSLYAVKELISRKNPVYVNFNVKSKNAIRLKVEHIIKEEILGYSRNGKPIVKKDLNYDFWNSIKNTGFDIIIDEVHNILHSRRSMSTWNTLISMWLAQIRKILGDSETNHLYLISQRIERIDVAARDLTDEIIYVSKTLDDSKMIKTRVYDSANKRYRFRMLPQVWIKKYHFTGAYCIEKFEAFLQGEDTDDFAAIFLGNPVMQFYDSYELLTFGQGVYL